MVASHVIAQQDIATRVKDWTQDLCIALSENYRNYHMRMLNRNLNDPTYSYKSYAQEQLDEIKNGTAKLMQFKILEGKKYYKIVQMEWRDANDYLERKAGYTYGSVNAFVDKKTGEVYKPASWKAPHTKHVRYDMRIMSQRQFLHNPDNVDWAGGYLYMR